MADTHSVIPKKLWQALMDAGVQHFDAGGTVHTQGTGGLRQGSGRDLGQGLGEAAQQTGNYLGDVYGNPATGQIPRPDKLPQDLMQGVNHAAGMVQDFAAAMTPQSNFQAQAPDLTMQNYAPQIQQLQQRQGDVYNQQQSLAQALLAQSQGQGPSPAQAMLAQQSGNNAAQQGALMASQRGAGANPALLARQAAQQGAAIQQNAVGQNAALKAQEQLAAQNSLQGLYGNVANQALQGESIQQGGLASQNSAVTQGQLGAQQINADTANRNAAQAGSGLGGLMGSIGAIGSLFHKGGEVEKMSDGGLMGIQHYESPGSLQHSSNPEKESKLGAGITSGITSLSKMLSQGGPVDGSLMQSGGDVPGHATVAGDSEKNDTVPTLLSPGEVVIPRSVMQGPDMEKKVLEFLKHLKNNKGGYDKVASAKKACGGYVK